VSRVREAERWAIMEWILYNRRLALAMILVVAVALASLLGALWGLGFGSLSPAEQAKYVQREEEVERPYGPLIHEVHSYVQTP
jgi:hypothetical protein